VPAFGLPQGSWFDVKLAAQQGRTGRLFAILLARRQGPSSSSNSRKSSSPQAQRREPGCDLREGEQDEHLWSSVNIAYTAAEMAKAQKTVSRRGPDAQQAVAEVHRHHRCAGQQAVGPESSDPVEPRVGSSRRDRGEPPSRAVPLQGDPWVSCLVTWSESSLHHDV